MKALVIGYGSIGKRHSRILSDQLNAEVHVVSRHGCDDYKTFSSLELVPVLNRYDYFVIATETILHYQQLKYLTENVNNKKILIEKPLFDKLESGFNIKYDNQVWVGYNLRFHSALQKVKSLIEGQSIKYVNCMVGEYLPWWRPGTDYRNSYSANISMGGGVLLDLSHEIDYLSWLFGEFTNGKSFIGKISSLDIQTDDLATAIVMTKTGTIINISMDYLSMIPVRRMLVYADQNTIELDLETGKVICCDYLKNRSDWIFSHERDYTYIEMHKSILYGNGVDCCSYNAGAQVMDSIEMLKSNLI